MDESPFSKVRYGKRLFGRDLVQDTVLHRLERGEGTKLNHVEENNGRVLDDVWHIFYSMYHGRLMAILHFAQKRNVD